jgi:hypothetical protein
MASGAAQATYQWAAHFVAQHNLCPWADRSVRTRNALQIVVLTYNEELETSLEAIAVQFQENFESGRADPNTAIIFCVILPPQNSKDDHWIEDFGSFYEWYLTTEDNWLDRADDDLSHVANSVTLAPFHPAWQFASDDEEKSLPNDSFALEKQSPYPTISMVSTRVIERAGEMATKQIVESNQVTLATKSKEEWKKIYHQAVFGNDPE